MIRLLLADDQELIRAALAVMLGLEDDFEVVATVGRGDEVVEAARAHRPDVALLDIDMPGIDGLAAAGALAHEVPECRSLILTTFGRPGYLRRAMESGAYDSWSRTRRPTGWRTQSAGSRPASGSSTPLWQLPRSPSAHPRSPRGNGTSSSRRGQGPP